MTSSATQSGPDDSLMYLGFTDADSSERHVSLVPYVPGLEAMCGQRLRTTRAGPWRAVVGAATCRTCAVRGVDVGRRAGID